MQTPRRDFLKTVAGAAALPIIATAAEAAPAAPKSWDSQLMGERRFIDVDGIRTGYYEAGKGEAMVLIHGGQWPAPSSADGWSSIFDHLAEHYRVYAFDKLGMGFTDNPQSDADYSMDAVIRHAHGFIKAVGIKRAIVVGQSRGAAPAARIAIDAPDLVSHLVIFDNNALSSGDIEMAERHDVPEKKQAPTRESIRKAAMASTQSIRKDFITDAYVEKVYRIATQPKIAEADRRFRDLLVQWRKNNPDRLKADPRLGYNVGANAWWLIDSKNQTLDLMRAGRLRTATVMIWGWNDAFAPYTLALDTMKILDKHVERLDLHILNRASHLLFAEYPVEVTRLMNNFIKA